MVRRVGPRGDRSLPLRRIELDVCGEHGIWLDRGELADVASRLLDERNPAPKAKGSGGSGDVVGGAIDLLLGVFGRL